MPDFDTGTLKLSSRIYAEKERKGSADYADYADYADLRLEERGLFFLNYSFVFKALFSKIQN